MRIKKLVGATEAELYDKFPWLQYADFENADIEISHGHLIWHDGIWKRGIFVGVWYNGTRHGGIWRSGDFRDGVWNDITYRSPLDEDKEEQ